MQKSEILDLVERLLEDAKTAVLATTDGNGSPRMRWMTPGLLKTRPGRIFAVTTPSAAKLLNLEKIPRVQWMFQDRALTKIVYVNGMMAGIQSPALKKEIIEELGSELTMFWKINREKTDFVVLETAPVDAEYFRPMLGKRERVVFHEEK